MKSKMFHVCYQFLIGSFFLKSINVYYLTPCTKRLTKESDGSLQP